MFSILQISVSNDGVLFSDPEDLIIFDSLCRSCASAADCALLVSGLVQNIECACVIQTRLFPTYLWTHNSNSAPKSFSSVPQSAKTSLEPISSNCQWLESVRKIVSKNNGLRKCTSIHKQTHFTFVFEEICPTQFETMNNSNNYALKLFAFCGWLVCCVVLPVRWWVTYNATCIGNSKPVEAISLE